MKDYSDINKEAFEELAPEYNKRWEIYLKHQEKILTPLQDYLRSTFKGPIKILDTGCGVGLDLYLFSRKNFQTYGIDFSPRMVRYAKKNSPLSKLLVADFLHDDISGGPFHAILMDAFIHLFPQKDTTHLLEKARFLLINDGYLYIATTSQKTRPKEKEGYFMKQDYNKPVERFRRFWTKKELLKIIRQSGFTIKSFYKDYEPVFKKTWMNIIAQKR